MASIDPQRLKIKGRGLGYFPKNYGKGVHNMVKKSGGTSFVRLLDVNKVLLLCVIPPHPPVSISDGQTKECILCQQKIVKNENVFVCFCNYLIIV